MIAVSTGREEMPWLTVRRDEMERLDRLAGMVDELSDDSLGLATALRKTPAYLRAIAGSALATAGFHQIAIG